MSGRLFEIISSATFDPGRFVTRLGVCFAGFDADTEEPLNAWQARAVAKALETEIADQSQRHMDESFSLADYVDALEEDEQLYHPAVTTLRALCWDLRA